MSVVPETSLVGVLDKLRLELVLDELKVHLLNFVVHTVNVKCKYLRSRSDCRIEIALSNIILPSADGLRISLMSLNSETMMTTKNKQRTTTVNRSNSTLLTFIIVIVLLQVFHYEFGESSLLGDQCSSGKHKMVHLKEDSIQSLPRHLLIFSTFRNFSSIHHENIVHRR